MNLFELVAILRLDSSEYEKGLDDASKKSTSVGSIVGKGLATVGKAGAVMLTAATGATVAFAKSSVDLGMQFDSTMSSVAAISGSTEEEMEALRKKAKEMGATTVWSANDAAEAMTYMGMAGWKADQMIAGLPGIMSLATAGGTDLATTSDIVTDAITAFGDKAEDAGRYANVMAAAATNSNTNVEMMGETFKYVAPLAGAMGYTLEDTSIAIGLMANSGIKASQAGTALRSILNRMAKPTKESEAAMAALGLSLSDDEGRMYSLYELMGQMRSAFGEGLMIPADKLQSSLAELDEQLEKGTLKQKDYDKEVGKLMERAYGAEGAVKAQYAAMLGGTTALSGLLAIVNASEEDFDKLSEAIYNSSGAADEMSDKMADNLSGQLKMMGAAMEALKLLVSEAITPTISQFVGMGTSAINAIVTGFEEGGVSGAIEALSAWFGEAIQSVSEMLPGLVEVGASVLDSLLKGITDNISAIASAATTILMTFTELVIGSAPQVFEAGAVMLAELGKGIGASLPELVPAAVEAVLSLADSLIENAPALIDGALALITGLGEGLINSLPTLIVRVPEIISALVMEIIKGIPKIGEAGGKLLGSLFANLPEITISLLESVAVLLNDIAQACFAGVASMIWAGWELISGLGKGVMDGVAEVIEPVKDVLQNIVDALIEGVPKIAEAGGQLLLGIVRDVNKVLPEILDSISRVVKDMIDTVIGGITGMASAGVDLIKGVGSGIVEGASGVIGTVKEAGSNVLGGVKDFFGIESPSKVMEEEVGQMLMLGIDKGLKDKFSTLEDTTADVSSLLMPEVPSVSVSGTQDRGTARLEALLTQMIDTLAGMHVTLDSKAVVGYLGPQIDSELGRILTHRIREAAYS